MRIIGYVHYAIDKPVPSPYLADNITLQLFGWGGAVHTVGIRSEQFKCYGLVFTDRPPMSVEETAKCLLYLEEELSRERAEMLIDEDDDVDEDVDE